MVLMPARVLLRTLTFPIHLPRITLPELMVLMLLVSFHLYGVGVLKFYGLSIAPWDWAIVVLVFLMASVPVLRTVRIRSSFTPVLFLAFLFTTWMGVSAFFSPQPDRALTMLLLQVRNLVLLLVIGTLFSNITSVELLNRKLLWVGTLIAGLALLMYISAWFRYSEIISSRELWKPGIGYELDQGGVLRLIGFAGDPNFYSLWIALPFFVGFTRRFSLQNLFAVIVIGLSVALAMSRGFALAFLISVVLLFFAQLITRARSMGYIKKLLVGMVIVTIGMVGLYFVASYDLSQFAQRVELVSKTPRWAMWEQLCEGLTEKWNAIVGTGLRGTEEALEGGYSHNSYLDVIFETGLIGFAVWSSIIVYVTIFALERTKELQWLPWVHTWLVILVMFGFFSLVYNPFPWLLAGVLTGAPFKDVNLKKEENCGLRRSPSAGEGIPR